MNNSEKASFILLHTNDGDDLNDHHMGIMQAAVNNNLTNSGQELLDTIYKQVKEGTYRRPWFHGIEHLTKDLEGYVYWKGKQIEHFSYSDFEREKESAGKLAARCIRLEKDNITVNINNVTGWSQSE